MRVLVTGSDVAKVNKIAVTTFLDGLHSEYENSLYIIHTGSGYISDIVDNWINKMWAGREARNSFNAEWLIKHWMEEDEAVGYSLIEECKPDLIFLFGYEEHEIHRPARVLDIPIFLVEKL